jgi:hypothetical protein
MTSKKKTAPKGKKSRTQKTFPLTQSLTVLLTDQPSQEDVNPLIHLQLPEATNTARPAKKKKPTAAETEKAIAKAEDAQKALLQRMANRKKVFIESMVKSLGVVTKAVQISGIPSRTHYTWLDTDPDYRDAIANIKEVTLDFYEDALHELIKQKNPAAVIFALKTQAKRRGYIETVHNINNNQDDANVHFYLPDNSRPSAPIEDAKIVS